MINNASLPVGRERDSVVQGTEYCETTVTESRPTLGPCCSMVRKSSHSRLTAAGRRGNGLYFFTDRTQWSLLGSEVRSMGIRQNDMAERIFRKGAVGALMDEYERAALDLKRTLESLSDVVYNKVIDPATEDENCRSIATIMSHVVSAGYSYADHLRRPFGIVSTRPVRRMLTRNESLEQIDAILAYTAGTLDGRWEMPEEQITDTKIQSSWGVAYDMEQLLEHAIVHILRHRRQIEKFCTMQPR